MGKNAFTVTFPPQVRAISTPCKISDSYSFDLDADMEHPQYFECSAAWDTGAVMSVISHQMAERLELNNMGFANMIHADGTSKVRTFFINLLLPNKMEVQMLQVMESNLIDTDMLIGMDVINLCDFAITHPNNETLFSFDTTKSHIIDFTKD